MRLINQKMLIGSESENVDISLYTLKNNSNLIRELYGDNLIDCVNFISKDIMNIQLYVEYLNNFSNFSNGTYEIKNLYDLFKTCYFLQDINTECVADNIILHIKNNDISIGESYRYLNLLYYSDVPYQTLKLLYTIVVKYGADAILDIVSCNKMDKLNKYIAYELSIV